MRTYKWEGPKCLSLTNSSCKYNEESGELKAKGVWKECVESKIPGKLKKDTATLLKSPEGKLCMLYPELNTNISPLPYS